MSFNSLAFLAFLPVVFCLYWFVFGRNLKWQNLFVVAASYIFYGWWDWRFLLLIAFTSFCTFGSGLLIRKYREEKPQRARWIRTANIVLNLGILALFKYYDFFAQSFADLFLGGRSDGLLLHLILPVGISFYTFQAVGYTVDVYRGQFEPVRDPVQFFAFLCFFPQLVAGPIERAADLLPQFGRRRNFDYATAVDGLRQMLWGFFKKVVVADSCAIYVNEVFAHYADYTGMQLIVAGLFFSVQVYGDFSGYSDIAVGTAKLFGIHLHRNFAFPLFSRSVTEFWRRWHVSLMLWFRDYIYIPLGGSRCSKLKQFRNTLIVFLVCGFWHGAKWTALAWGAYTALLYIPYILSAKKKKYRDTVAQDRALPSLKETALIARTLVLTTIGNTIVRSDTLSQAGDMLLRMVRWTPGTGLSFLLTGEFLQRMIWIIPMLLVEWRDRRLEHGLSMQGIHSRPVRYAVYIALLFLVALFFDNQSPDFIYFQF